MIDRSSGKEQAEWICRDRKLSYSDRTLVMGILNVTPDSFSDGGQFYTPELALRHALEMEKEGADIIDIGAESTRPGSEIISTDEELSRLIPALKLICENVKIPVSVDTYKSKTAEEALKFGASIVNDVWGLQKDPAMAQVVARYRAGVVLMANYTDPSIYKRAGSIEEDCVAFWKKSAQIAESAGIEPGAILYDPGIGFGTDTEESLKILTKTESWKEQGYPVLIGASRKRFVGATLGGVPVEERDAATLSTSIYCAQNKVACVRVHNVLATTHGLTMWYAMKGAERG